MKREPLTPDDPDSRLDNQVRHALNVSLETISPRQQAQLNAARRKALASRSASARPAWQGWMGATGLATSCLIALLVLWPATNTPTLDGFADVLPLLELETDEVELIEELEFVYWLQEQDKVAREQG